jgi:cytochrome c-type biogenesis protein CcmH
MKRWTILLVLGLTLLWTAAAAAQEPVTDDDVNDVARELYCPVCESTPLDVCGTQACEDWRSVIRTQLDEGRSSDEIKDYFALQYGDRVLAEPPRSGFTLLLWVLPFVAIILGGGLLGRYLLQMRREGTAAATEAENRPVPPPVPERSEPQAPLEKYLAQIEIELQDS